LADVTRPIASATTGRQQLDDRTRWVDVTHDSRRFL
jgi:hypothetical protein